MKHILIVEDDAENNQMLREYLESHGYTCTQAFSGSEGKLLFSMVRDKQYRKAAQALAGSGLFDEIGLAALSEERALPLQTLEDSFGQYTGICVRAYDTLEAAFTKLLSQREDKDRVYIVGSLYLAGEIKALIRRSVHDQF